jgi:hypothetical protein
MRTRFVFYTEVDATSSLRLANASGGGAVVLESTKTGNLRGASWSPDGQWISYLRSVGGRNDLVKIRAQPGAVPEILANARVQDSGPRVTRWSPRGDWIAYPGPAGIDLISPDGKSTRTLTSRRFLAYSFSKDGSQLYGLFRNTSTEQNEHPNTAQWQLFSVSVNSGAETFLASIDLPGSVERLAGLSIHPDGTRFLTSVARWPFDIWMLEGFDPPHSKSGIDRLLRR